MGTLRSSGKPSQVKDSAIEIPDISAFPPNPRNLAPLRPLNTVAPLAAFLPEAVPPAPVAPFPVLPEHEGTPRCLPIMPLYPCA
jgi:hypothetical protein